MRDLTIAWDTALAGAGMAVFDQGGKALLSQQCTDFMKSSQFLVESLRDAELELNQLFTSAANLVIGVGPGSFTGIKVGISMAQAVSTAHPHLKVVGVNSLETLFAAMGCKGHLFLRATKMAGYVVRQDGNGGFSLGVVDVGARVIRIQAVESSLHEVLSNEEAQLVSPWPELGEFSCLDMNQAYPRMFEYMFGLRHSEPVDAHALGPHYLRGSAAEEKNGAQA